MDVLLRTALTSVKGQRPECGDGDGRSAGTEQPAHNLGPATDRALPIAPDECGPPISTAGSRKSAAGTTSAREGPLSVPTELAEQLAAWVAKRDLDVAISRRMEVDHGAVQPLEILLGGIDTVPTIPVFVNGVAEPFTRMARVRRLGEGDRLVPRHAGGRAGARPRLRRPLPRPAGAAVGHG